MAQRSTTEIIALANANLGDNNSRDITPALLRALVIDLAESSVNRVDDVIFEAVSTADSVPSGTGDANKAQVSFGAAQSTPEVTLSAGGSITFVNAGNYIIEVTGRFGRTGTSHTTIINVAAFSPTQISETFCTEINGEGSHSHTMRMPVTVSANQSVDIYVMRDQGGENDGGLYGKTITDWNDAPAAMLRISKVNAS